MQAVRVGGLLTCVSLLTALSVFVFDGATLHVHMTRGSSRMRSPLTRRKRLPERGPERSVTLHWHPLVDTATGCAVGVIDALVQAVRCQQPRHAVATLDSALNKAVIEPAQLVDVFALLPQRLGVIRDLVDGRAEAGTETLVRLMARALGFTVELQVSFDGIGRVDLVLDGWLVVECDSREFHSSWEQQVKDYRRDKLLAQRGYAVLRLTAADILYHPESVVAALRGLRRLSPSR
jgi:very-short-patch-repair endonuclease